MLRKLSLVPLLAAITIYHLNSILSIRSDRNSSGTKVGYSITIALSSKKIRVSLVVCLGVSSCITIGSYSLLRRKKPS
ncbi:hypothetical protein ACN38_g4881, partial [Penicillium nordicum]